MKDSAPSPTASAYQTVEGRLSGDLRKTPCPDPSGRPYPLPPLPPCHVPSGDQAFTSTGQALCPSFKGLLSRWDQARTKDGSTADRHLGKEVAIHPKMDLGPGLPSVDTGYTGSGCTCGLTLLETLETSFSLPCPLLRPGNRFRRRH